MHDITHDGIEVTDYSRVTLVSDNINNILESIQRIVQLVFLIVGDALIIIQSHFVRIILTSIPAKRDHSVTILGLPCITHQLQTGCSIIRGNLQSLFQDYLDTILRHLFQIHIGCTEQRHISILLWHLENAVEQLQHTSGITS